MPNNANARREKDKKRKDKERKTVPPSLPQEDKTNADISSLSLAAEDKAGMDISSSLSLAGTREVLEGETSEQETLGTTTSWFLSFTGRKISEDWATAKGKPRSIGRGNQNTLPCISFE